MPKALITGGAGFIGSHTVDRFLAAGYDVHVLDDLSSGKKANLPGAATLHQADVRSEAAAIIRESRFDIIAHLAAQIDVRRSIEHPRFDADVNIAGTINILEAIRARRDESPSRFVFVSTGGALYGDVMTNAADELTPKNPDSPYGIAKLAAEYYAAFYGRIHKLETAVVRLGNVYGPRQDPHGEAGVVAIFCGRVGAGTPVTVFGTGKQTRDYVFVGDVARAVFTVATTALPPVGALDARAFNIATGVGTSVLDLAHELGRVAGKTPEISYAPERRGELLASVLDCTKAQKLLGWNAATPLRDGLKETYQWFLDNGGA